MMEFLSDQWCEALVERCAQSSVPLRDVTVEVQLTGAPRGKGRVSVVVADGRLVSCTLDRDADAELKLKLAFSDAVALSRGELDPSVAFMAGDMKTDGPTGPLLALLAAWRQPGVLAARPAFAAPPVEAD